MKKYRLLLIVLLGIGIMFSSSSQYAIAMDGIGEYVSTAAPTGATAVLPPGHFGLIAGYADDLLSASTAKTFRFVTAVELNANTAAYFILDLRAPSTYCTPGHIAGAAGAVNISLTNVAHPETLSMLPMDTPIVVICGSGQSASFVTAILQLLGYDAYALEGGMTAWMNAGFPLEGCS